MTPQGSPLPVLEGLRLKTYTIKEILTNFVSDATAKKAENMLDPANYTAENLVQRSVSFTEWLCMLPVVTTIYCVKAYFSFVVALV